jgi:hypothetical protein
VFGSEEVAFVDSKSKVDARNYTGLKHGHLYLSLPEVSSEVPNNVVNVRQSEWETNQHVENKREQVKWLVEIYWTSGCGVGPWPS